MDINQVDVFAKEIIFEAGRRIRESFSYDIEIETKSFGAVMNASMVVITHLVSIQMKAHKRCPP